MSKLRFLLLFLVLFATFLTLWSLTPAAQFYTDVLLWLAAHTGPIVHGWVLIEPSTDEGFRRWVHGGTSVDLRIQFDALAIGVVPLFALIGATPGLRFLRGLRIALVGLLLCLTIDTVIVALFPLLVHHENAVTGIGGTFLGMIGFVGAPVIVWFTLTHREIRAWLPSLQDRADGAA